MMPWKDITGIRYGRVVCLSMLPKEGKSYERWMVRCDCGTEFITTKANLRNGRTRSCGCYRREVLSAMLKEKEIYKLAHTRAR